MGYGDFIILAVFAIGYIIIFCYQKDKIDSLKTQIESQSGVLSSMQTFMSIFKLEEIERYVEMSRKKFLMEKDDDIKALKEKLEAKTKKNYGFLFNEYLDVSEALIKLSFAFGAHPYFETTILEMKSVVQKEYLLERIKKKKEELKAQGFDANIWSSLMTQYAFFKSLTEKKENQTPSQKKEK